MLRRPPVQLYLCFLGVLAFVPQRKAEVFDASAGCQRQSQDHSDDWHDGYNYNYALRPNYQAIPANNSTVVPSWEDHVARVLCCSPGAPLQGQFYLDKAGHYVYEPDACRLCPPTGAQARQCLAMRELIFLGDSLTRYQYLSLAHLLSALRFPGRYGTAPGRPSICLEKEWPNWGTFYEQSSAILSNSVAACGREVCDCFRVEQRCRDDAWDEDAFRKMRELRALRINLEGGGDVAVSFRQALPFPDFVEACVQPLDELAGAARAGAPVPAVLIMNVGHWWYHFQGSSPHDMLAHIFQAGGRFQAATNGTTRLIWQTTTANRDRAYEHAHVERKLAVDHGWQLLDTYRVSRSAQLKGLNLYWDPFHFLPVVYETHNRILLAELCPSIAGAALPGLLTGG